MEEFDEFKDEEAEAAENAPNTGEFIPVRVKLPRKNEVIGIIGQRLGASRMSVDCVDKKTRNCRVPGRLKRKLWLRAGDVVIIELWEFDNEKGDVIFKYTPTQIEWLKRKGFLKTEDTGF